jgi:hypothetical protein
MTIEIAFRCRLSGVNKSTHFRVLTLPGGQKHPNLAHSSGAEIALFFDVGIL